MSNANIYMSVHECRGCGLGILIITNDQFLAKIVAKYLLALNVRNCTDLNLIAMNCMQYEHLR